jgi:hypothetical protein
MATAKNYADAAELLAAKLTGDSWRADMAREMGDPEGMLDAITDFLAAAFQPLDKCAGELFASALSGGPEGFADYAP